MSTLENEKVQNDQRHGKFIWGHSGGGFFGCFWKEQFQFVAVMVVMTFLISLMEHKIEFTRVKKEESEMRTIFLLHAATF